MNGEILEYIEKQPDNRIEFLRKLRDIIKTNLPEGFVETLQYGMISYVVPHSIYEKGYHVNPKEPLPFISLGNQKKHIAIYHNGIYQDQKLLDWFKEEYKKKDIGKLDMGKSCIRLKKMEKIPYDLIVELCKKMTVSEYIDLYEKSIKR